MLPAPSSGPEHSLRLLTLEELDRAGYVAITMKDTAVTVTSGPSRLSSPEESNTPPTVVEEACRGKGDGRASAASLRLEVCGCWRAPSTAKGVFALCSLQQKKAGRKEGML